MNKYNLTNDIVSQLVQKINKETSKIEREEVGHQQQSYASQHILVVFTGTNFGLNESLKELTKARRYGFTFDIAMTNNGQDVIGSQGISVIKSTLQSNNFYTEKDKLIFGEIIESVDGIIVPMATQDTATKLAIGIQDCFISTLLWQALWHGKKVLMDFDNVLEYRGNKSKTPILQQMMVEYVDKLQMMGVKGVDKKSYVVEMLNSFKDSLTYEKANIQNSQKGATDQNYSTQQIITEKDLINMGDHNKEVTVPMRAIITPLAYDKAKQLGIKIIKGH